MNKFKIITSMIFILIGNIFFVGQVAGASGSPFSAATHNIEHDNGGALKYVGANDRPLTMAAQEVCAVPLLALTSDLYQYGYRNRQVETTTSGSSVCGGMQLYDSVYSQAAEMTCGVEACGVTDQYPANLQDPDIPSYVRGYACIRGMFGVSWVSCSTQLAVKQSYAVFQAAFYRNNVLGGESNFRVKIAAGDFNMRPRSYGKGTYGLDFFYESYREADNYYYDRSINRTTRNPPSSFQKQKIDYVFAGKFWTTDYTALQDRRCATGSDHCLVIGTFRWNI